MKAIDGHPIVDVEQWAVFERGGGRVSRHFPSEASAETYLQILLDRRGRLERFLDWITEFEPFEIRRTDTWLWADGGGTE